MTSTTPSALKITINPVLVTDENAEQEVRGYVVTNEEQESEGVTLSPEGDWITKIHTFTSMSKAALAIQRLGNKSPFHLT